MTHGSIKRTYVPIHFDHDVLIQDNNATICNDQNDAFNKALVDIFILGVFNPKGYVYSQPQGRF